MLPVLFWSVFNNFLNFWLIEEYTERIIFIIYDILCGFIREWVVGWFNKNKQYTVKNNIYLLNKIGTIYVIQIPITLNSHTNLQYINLYIYTYIYHYRIKSRSHSWSSLSMPDGLSIIPPFHQPFSSYIQPVYSKSLSRNAYPHNSAA